MLYLSRCFSWCDASFFPESHHGSQWPSGRLTRVKVPSPRTMARYESNIEHAGFYGTRASYRARMVRGWFRVDRDAGTKRVNEEETKKKQKNRAMERCTRIG